MRTLKKLLLLVCISFPLILSGCSGNSQTSADDSSFINSVLESSESTSSEDETELKIMDIYNLYLASGGDMSYEEWLESIKGDKGDPGKDGSKILFGDGAPTSSLGNIGDFYIDLSTCDLYFKESAGWAIKCNIKGSEGQDGKDGLTPYIGENGNWFIGGVDTGVKAHGEDGKAGASVLTGEGTPSSNLGRDGDSYIDTLTWDYYIKENGSWVLKGNIKGQDYVSDNNQGLEFFLTDDNTYYVSQGTSKLLSNIAIPSTHNGLPVTGIMDNGFEGSKAKSIVIPDSVTSIGERAFWYCSKLTSIVIPDSVTSIGNDAFHGCSSLTSITIPDSVTSIGLGAFQDCSSLTSITIPDSVTSIGLGAFQDCSSLTSITIPDSVTSIGSYVFYGCSSLTSITIPDSVTSIGFRAFYYCSSLSSIVIPDSVTSIGNDAFYGCSSLTSIVIPDSVTSIGNYAFCGCSSLTSIVIPDSVTSIGNDAFNGCFSLTSITIPDSVTSIGSYVFYGCSSLTSITIPDSVTSIGFRAFYYCSSLSSIVIPDSVISIGDYAFHDCSSLTSIVIPDSVTSIGNYAFDDCSSLSIVYYEGTIVEWNSISIGGGNSKLRNATRYYYSEEEPTDPGYFWHYVDGVPTIW